VFIDASLAETVRKLSLVYGISHLIEAVAMDADRKAQGMPHLPRTSATFARLATDLRVARNAAFASDKPTEKADAIEALRERGAENLKAEDRFGDTRVGWWLDGVWLAPANDPVAALRTLNGAC
jgi:hypothetical protein